MSNLESVLAEVERLSDGRVGIHTERQLAIYSVYGPRIAKALRIAVEYLEAYLRGEQCISGYRTMQDIHKLFDEPREDNGNNAEKIMERVNEKESDS